MSSDRWDVRLNRALSEEVEEFRDTRGLNNAEALRRLCRQGLAAERERSHRLHQFIQNALLVSFSSAVLAVIFGVGLAETTIAYAGGVLGGIALLLSIIYAAAVWGLAE